MLSPFCRGARALLLPLIVTAGCGGTPEPPRAGVPVRGSVLVDGKPAVRAQVVFHPLGDPAAARPSGEVGADGTFILGTLTADDGAAPGEYAVTVFWPDGSEAIGGDADSDKDRLGNRYSDPKTSPLRVRVEPGTTDLKPFHLHR